MQCICLPIFHYCLPIFFLSHTNSLLFSPVQKYFPILNFPTVAFLVLFSVICFLTSTLPWFSSHDIPFIPVFPILLFHFLFLSRFNYKLFFICLPFSIISYFLFVSPFQFYLPWLGTHMCQTTIFFTIHLYGERCIFFKFLLLFLIRFKVHFWWHVKQLLQRRTLLDWLYSFFSTAITLSSIFKILAPFIESEI